MTDDDLLLKYLPVMAKDIQKACSDLDSDPQYLLLKCHKETFEFYRYNYKRFWKKHNE